MTCTLDRRDPMRATRDWRACLNRAGLQRRAPIRSGTSSERPANGGVSVRRRSGSAFQERLESAPPGEAADAIAEIRCCRAARSRLILLTGSPAAKFMLTMCCRSHRRQGAGFHLIGARDLEGDPGRTDDWLDCNDIRMIVAQCSRVGALIRSARRPSIGENG
jgi:hypothetical protein